MPHLANVATIGAFGPAHPRPPFPIAALATALGFTVNLALCGALLAWAFVS